MRAHDLIKLNTAGTLPGIHLLAYATFGRDAARLGALLEFLTWLSIALWSCVALSILLRTGAHYVHIWNQRRAHAATNHNAPGQNIE